MPKIEGYLGDGVQASFAHGQVVLSAPATSGPRAIYLEREVTLALIRFAVGAGQVVREDLTRIAAELEKR